MEARELETRAREIPLRIRNRRGYELSAILTPVDDATTSKKKIVILTHSFKGDKNYQPIMREFPQAAQVAGFNVLRFDCYGSGESPGKFEDATITSEIEDLQDVIRDVAKQGYTHVGLAGLSLGTTVSLYASYAEDNPELLKCLVLWSPAFNLQRTYNSYKQEMQEKGYIIRERTLTGEKVKVGKPMWEEMGRIDAKEVLRATVAPTLALLGSADTHTTPAQAEAYLSCMPIMEPRRKLKVIPGGDHDFLVESARERAIDISLMWLRKYL
jgi:pimeloyl-ACP methyl ester carboxylesterase